MGSKTTKIILALIIATAAVVAISFNLQKTIAFDWPFEDVGMITITPSDYCLLTYAQEDIRFDHPCDWKVRSNDDNAIRLSHFDDTPPGTAVIMDIPATKSNQVGEPTSGQLKINRTAYNIDRYVGQDALTYVVEMDGNTISFGSESGIRDEDLKSILLILSSVRF